MTAWPFLLEHEIKRNGARHHDNKDEKSEILDEIAHHNQAARE